MEDLMICWFLTIQHQSILEVYERTALAATDRRGVYRMAHPRLAYIHLCAFESQKSGLASVKLMFGFQSTSVSTFASSRLLSSTNDFLQADTHLLADAVRCIDDGPDAFLVRNAHHLLPRHQYAWVCRDRVDHSNDLIPLPRSVLREPRRERREDRKSTRLNSSHSGESRMPSSA